MQSMIFTKSVGSGSLVGMTTPTLALFGEQWEMQTCRPDFVVATCQKHVRVLVDAAVTEALPLLNFKLSMVC